MPTATSSPGPTPTPNRTLTIDTGYGEINGVDDQIKTNYPNKHTSNQGEGDMAGTEPGSAPGGGGNGQVIDGTLSCVNMANNYHVHAFVGLYVNGQEIAIPDGIGMLNPAGDMTYNGVPNQEVYADCFYQLHTHDPSGELHIEAMSQTPCGWKNGVYYGPCNFSLYTFGNFLDEWGVTLNNSMNGNFGPFFGPVQIYTTPPEYLPCPATGACYTGSNEYSLYTGDPYQIPLYSHTVVWILVGSGNPTGSALPNIQWVAGNP